MTLLAFITSLTFRLLLATVVLASFAIYGSLNRPDDAAAVLATRLDNRIPFWPVFSVPYLLYFPLLLFVVVYGIAASSSFAKIALTFLSVQLIAALLYHRHQTHVPRPPMFRSRDLFHRLTAVIYRHDQPYCTFPSLHVAYSILCGYWLAVLFPALLPLIVILVLAIMASTLFLKQHVIADVCAGTALAGLCLMIAIR